MGLFNEIPPTAGLPLLGADVLALLRERPRPDALEQNFKTCLHLEYARVVCSGTAALYVILQSVKALSPKTTVIIPAYTCPLVPLAVHRAGLKVEVCDVNPANFDFNHEELDTLCAATPDAVAIIATHIAGIPADLEAISRIATRHQLFVIEDCAQALGAIYRGQPVGTWGDFAFFSLARGKGVTIYEGGVFTTKHAAHAALLDRTLAVVIPHAWMLEGLRLVELCSYGVFYRPALFWLAYRLPEMVWKLSGNPLRVAREQFSLEFPLHRVSSIRQAVGHVMFARLEESITHQRQLAHAYHAALQRTSGLTLVMEDAASRATYPCLAVRFKHREQRDEALARCRPLGIGAAQMFTAAIGEYDYLRGIVPPRDYPNARAIAQHELTLSTSQFVTPRVIHVAAETLKAVLESPRSAHLTSPLRRQSRPR